MRPELMSARNRWPWPGQAGLDQIQQGDYRTLLEAA